MPGLLLVAGLSAVGSFSTHVPRMSPGILSVLVRLCASASATTSAAMLDAKSPSTAPLSAFLFLGIVFLRLMVSLVNDGNVGDDHEGPTGLECIVAVLALALALGSPFWVHEFSRQAFNEALGLSLLVIVLFPQFVSCTLSALFPRVGGRGRGSNDEEARPERVPDEEKWLAGILFALLLLLTVLAFAKLPEQVKYHHWFPHELVLAAYILAVGLPFLFSLWKDYRDAFADLRVWMLLLLGTFGAAMGLYCLRSCLPSGWPQELPAWAVPGPFFKTWLALAGIAGQLASWDRTQAWLKEMYGAPGVRPLRFSPKNYVRFFVGSALFASSATGLAASSRVWQSVIQTALPGAASEAHLHLELRVVPPCGLRLNDKIWFYVYLYNDGPHTATNVAVLDKIPEGMVPKDVRLWQYDPTNDSWPEFQGPPSYYDSVSGMWLAGSLEQDGRARLGICVSPVREGVFLDSAEIVHSDQYDPDSSHHREVVVISIPAVCTPTPTPPASPTGTSTPSSSPTPTATGSPPPLGAQLDVLVWQDGNRNGRREIEEEGLSGVDAYVALDDGASHNLVKAAATGGGGACRVSDLRPGRYIITVRLPTQYELTTPNGLPRELGPGDLDRVTFGACLAPTATSTPSATAPALAAVLGQVWNDLDGDGLPGGGEPGLLGQQVLLYEDRPTGQSGPPMATRTTSGNGGFEFLSLPSGTYIIRAELTEGYRLTTQNEVKVALAESKKAVVYFGGRAVTPTQTATPTLSPTATATAKKSPTVTHTSTATLTPTQTPTATSPPPRPLPPPPRPLPPPPRPLPTSSSGAGEAEGAGLLVADGLSALALVCLGSPPRRKEE